MIPPIRGMFPAGFWADPEVFLKIKWFELIQDCGISKFAKFKAKEKQIKHLPFSSRPSKETLPQHKTVLELPFILDYRPKRPHKPFFSLSFLTMFLTKEK